jgi:hypothetical protein
MLPLKAVGSDGKLLMHPDNPISLLDGSVYLSTIYYFKLNEVEIGNSEVITNRLNRIFCNPTMSRTRL